ncbi:MAG TPA: MaoC family dehydratase [Candidatus Eisenbacteria bacterium]|nr:MaoC family dehydratase [Candidatus Eisenbacteria bacterium]
MIAVGYEFPPVEVLVTREMIRAYAVASHDFNPLHLDHDWMKAAEFGPTRFGSVIAHGLMTYSLVTRMLTDVVYPLGGWHERCEMRFMAPVLPGDRIRTAGRVTNVRRTGDRLRYAASVEARKPDGTVVATGDAMGHVPGEARAGE